MPVFSTSFLHFCIWGFHHSKKNVLRIPSSFMTGFKLCIKLQQDLHRNSFWKLFTPYHSQYDFLHLLSFSTDWSNYSFEEFELSPNKFYQSPDSRGSTKMTVLSSPGYRTVTSFISVCYRSNRTVISAYVFWEITEKISVIPLP